MVPKKIVEGVFEIGQKCVIIEDIVTSGASVIETYEVLKQEGLEVEDAIVLIDREQGGTRNIANFGIKLHPIITISSVLHLLKVKNLLSDELVLKVKKFIIDNQLGEDIPKQLQSVSKSLTYHERAEVTCNLVAKQLFNLMDSKKTNLCLSVDVTKKADILRIVNSLGEHVCVVKTHVDIIEDFDSDFVKDLAGLAEKYNFLIFEDRKFADIGNTVKLQYNKGIYSIVDWAHITNCHVISGEGIIKGLKQIGLPKNRSLLLLAEMSSEGNLAQGNYTQKTLDMALKHRDFVIGFICTKQLTPNQPEFIHFTPGVKLVAGMDELGQKYQTPHDVIASNKSDIIIVGRGIYEATDVINEAKKYREAGWAAYQERINK